MKILMVNKFLYPRGGAETYVIRLGAELTRRGHQVEYFGMYDEKNIVGNADGLTTAPMDFHTRSPARFAYPFRILYSQESLRKMGKVLDRFRPDVVHLNNINFQLTPAVIDAAANRGVPLVQTVHDYQMICPNHMLYNEKEKRVCQRCVGGGRWNCARFRCIHGSLVKSVLGAVEGDLSWGRHSYERVGRYICPSRFLAEKLLEASTIYRDRLEVLHNFVELPDPHEMPPQGEPGEEYVAFAGRLSREKGLDLLAQAARLLPGVTFRVAGSGEMAPILRDIPNVELLGFLTGKPLRALIAGARAVLVPSVWYENCPLSILEAHALGTPVVTVDRGGMAELVEDGVTGVTFRELSGRALADAVERLLSDRAVLARMRENCLRRREELPTLERYCVRMEEIYREEIRRKERGTWPQR